MNHIFSRALICFIFLGSIVSTVAYAQSSPSSYTSALRYDAKGRVAGTIAPDPDGSGALKYAASRTTYDVKGLPIKLESGELSSWKSEAVLPVNWTGFAVLSSVETTYDALDRRIKEVTKGSGGTITGVTQFSYDLRGRLECSAVRMNPSIYNNLPSSACTLGAAGSQGPDRITKNVYDGLSQIVKVQKAVGTSIQQDYVSYSYTDNRQKKTVTDANGNKATFSYDGHDRLIKWQFPDKTSTGVSSSTDFEQYTYDNNGNKLTHRKRDGSVLSYQYDNLNRMTLKTVPSRAGLSSTHTRDVFYRYDLRGLQLRARFDNIDGEGVTNTYDGFGRMISSQINMSGLYKTLTYQYDKNGNRTQVEHPDSQQFNYTYDGLNRSDSVKRSTETLLNYDYINRGLLKSMTGGVTTNFTYDNVGRLSSLNHNLDGSASDVTFGFDFNPARQVTSRSISNDTYVWDDDINVNRNYTVNGLNQYISAGPASFTYDANGNLTSDGSVSYLYDVENRLVKATGAMTASLRYDPIGRLFETDAGSSATRTRFHYDGDELVAEYGNSHSLLRRYVHGRNIDDPVIWYEGAGVSTGVVRRLRADHQGSIVAVTNWSGSPVAINAYDDWGIPAATNLGRFQYTGQIHIPELDMYYYKARIYSPTLGRFLQTDPIGYEDNINLYAYVGNDPVNMVDPTGKQADPTLLGLQHARDHGSLDEDSHETITGIIHDNNAIALSMAAPYGGMFKIPAAAGWAARAYTFGRISGALSKGKSLVLYSGNVPKLNAGKEFALKTYGWTIGFNDKVMRSVIKAGRTVRDSHVDKMGRQIQARRGSVLDRERRMLKKAGYKFNRKNQRYEPPTPEYNASTTRVGNRGLTP